MAELLLVEPDPGLLGAAGRRLDGLARGRVRQAQGDVHAVDGVHDLVIASHVAYYIDDITSWGRRLRSACDQQGVCCVVLRSPDCLTAGLRAAVSRYYGQAPKFLLPRVEGMLRSESHQVDVDDVPYSMRLELQHVDPTDLLNDEELDGFVRWMTRFPLDETWPPDLRRSLHRLLVPHLEESTLNLPLADVVLSVEGSGTAMR